MGKNLNFFHLILCLGLISLNCPFTNAKSVHQSVVHMSQQEDLEHQSSNDHADNNGVNNVSGQQKYGAPSELTFAKIFQDNMVLQRGPARARIFGFSPDIGAKIIAEMRTEDKNYYYSTFVTPDKENGGGGSWVITLDPMTSTKPVTISVLSEGKTLTLSNVLFGDVWLCSGQSNMEFTVYQMLNGAQEAADSSQYPDIRLMSVAEKQSPTPFNDVASLLQNWTLPSASVLSNKPWNYFSAVCWLYGKHLYQSLGYPIGLIASDWGGTPVEAWSSPQALAKCHMGEEDLQKPAEQNDGNVNGPWGNSVLWNAMIYPLLGMTIRGSIWYQGEDDARTVKTMNHYNCTFPTMIADWREKFSAVSQQQTSNSFPFGFVQLSAQRPGNITTGFPDIRWHQTADYGYAPNPKMPNTFMAVAMDLPDFKSTWNNIHPRDKEDVGYRLALAGLAVAYKQKVVFQGPYPVTGHFTAQGTITVDYGNKWTLNIKSLNGFEVLCEPNFNSESTLSTTNGQWYPMPISAKTSTILTFNTTTICGSAKPQAIRYAWLESPCPFKGCAVYSTINDLPGPPFYAKFSYNTMKKKSDGDGSSSYSYGELMFKS